MAGDHDAARAAMFAIRTRMNHEAILYFAICAAILIVIFTLINVSRTASRRLGLSIHTATVFLPLRRFGSFFLLKAPGHPSLGHASVVAIYTLINLLLTFTHFDLQNMPLLPSVASRTAWLAMANLVVVVVLSLKNTPLSFLISWSYERLNPLHQVAGYATIIHVILHTACYCSYFVAAGRSSRLLYTAEIYGMVAGLCFVGLGISGAFVRRWWYELFYYLHISFWVIGLVTVGLHQPEVSKKVIFATRACGGIWMIDRMLRLARLAANSVSNEVTIYPLPNRATRVVLKKRPLGAISGKHCFLWIPRIRTFETHPFTIASTDPVEFIIASYDGFTQELHRYAVENPGTILRASVDGAYGTFPKPQDYDKAVLIAGGSGASFTFGAALSALESRSTEKEKSELVFVWMVKSYSHLTWYANQIRTLRLHDRVSVRLFVTRPLVELVETPTNDLTPTSTTESGLSDGSTHQGGCSIETEKDLSELENQTTLSPGDSGSDSDAPSPMEGMTREIEGVAVHYQRPNVEEIIRTEVRETASDQRVVVLGCGPDRLMKKVRSATASSIRGDSPSVELHCEQFGW